MSSKFFLLISAILSFLIIYFSQSTNPPPHQDPFLPPEASSPQANPLVDISSQANINEVRTIHFYLEIKLDLSTQKISGTNTLTLYSLISNLTEVHLDVRNMTIFEVRDNNGETLEFKIEPNPDGDESIGDKLRIYLKSAPQMWKPFNIYVLYETSPTATALNWLKPEQTSSKTKPYLFSQCESIHCRTLAPLQDTPAIKSTYSANVTVENDINVFMSANLTYKMQTPWGTTHYYFSCDIPIPSYLLAIVAGNVTEKQVGPRTFVITEPNDLPAFSKELEDLESYLQTVENYITPYHWGYYKIVILPPSFPYGGMENPLLTFASPTIIAGDKSGVFVVIHEIGHSWTGNWVTCQNWQNFWLNEGFTVFLERKGGYILHGFDRWAIAAIVGNFTMLDDFRAYGFNDSFSSLHPQLKGRNPDDSMSTVPYEKGFQFLVYLESLIGVDKFQSFLRSYVERFAMQSPVYEELAEYFNTFISANLENASYIFDKVDWNEWILQPGLPPIDMSDYFKNKVLGDAYKLAQDFIDGQGSILPNNSQIFQSFDMNLKLLFLQYFVDRNASVSLNLISLLNSAYSLDNNTNSEVYFIWLRLNVLVDNVNSFELVEKFLGKTGRMKFVRPLYLGLNEKHHDLAVKIFREYEGFYHPIAVRLIKQDLAIN